MNPPPAPRKCSDDAAGAAHGRYLAGELARHLAPDLGLSESALRRRWTCMGLVERVKARPPRRPKKCSDEAAVAALARHRAGELVRHLAPEIGLSPSGLERRWKRMGLVDPCPNRPITGAEVATVARAVTSGTSILASARNIGRSPAQLRRYLHRRGIRGTTPAGAAVPARVSRDRRVVGLLLDGRTWREIITELGEIGCPRQARNRLLQGVRRYCEREAIPLPPGAVRGLAG